ncbi:hypothetical protein [Chryseobacterium sp.]|uniref:hypothetical protein n=1 Tax=Chryseobacterium sp. TaxID=1871047 RepID=UPI003890E41D
MQILYAARGTYDEFTNDEFGWKQYKEWSRLPQLDELVSLDGMLNEDLVEPDYNSAYDWENIHVSGNIQTGFYHSVDFVLQKMVKRDQFNFLAVIIEPTQDCSYHYFEGFEWMGYDLLDQYFSISALTNCGGFDESFLPSELNHNGLLSDFNRAKEVQADLFTNNPNEDHANTHCIAVWRNKDIGR